VLGIGEGEPEAKKNGRKLFKELWPTQGCYAAAADDDDEEEEEEEDELTELSRV
jgi:hypothetical protein